MSNQIPSPSSRMAEYGAVPAGQFARKQVIAHGETTEGLVATLAYTPAGYVCAGSMARFDEANWSVTVEVQDESHGRKFLDTNDGETKARALFAEWTDPVKVAAARVERAHYLAECAVIQAERDAEQRARYLECCAERGLNPNTKRARAMFRWYRGG